MKHHFSLGLVRRRKKYRGIVPHVPHALTAIRFPHTSPLRCTDSKYCLLVDADTDDTVDIHDIFLKRGILFSVEHSLSTRNPYWLPHLCVSDTILDEAVRISNTKCDKSPLQRKISYRCRFSVASYK